MQSLENKKKLLYMSGTRLPRMVAVRAAKSEGASVPRDTEELLGRCCDEFAVLATEEAARATARDGKSVLGPKHLREALRGMGFDYDNQLEVVQQEYGTQAKAKKLKRSAQAAIDPAEAERLQELMFAQAAAEMNGDE